MFTATVDLADFHREAARAHSLLVSATAIAAREAAEAGRDEAKRGQFKDQTGTLRGRIDAKALSGGEWEIVAPTPYALFVEVGTRPHPIYPKRASVLRFYLGGRTVFARSVQHPGTRAYAFMGHAYEIAERVLYARAEAAVGRIFRDWT